MAQEGASTSGISPAAASDGLVLAEGGTYIAWAQVNGTDAGPFALRLNGADIPGGVLPVNGGSTSGLVAFTAAPGDTLTLVNASTDTAANLTASDPAGAVNASLLVRQVAPAV